MGMPPCNGVKYASGKATIAVRPFLMISSNALVGRLKSAAVRALPIEILAPAAKVPSNRSSAIRLPPSSTTAMTPPGALFFFAYATAPAITFLAPSIVSVFFSTVCALDKTPTVKTVRAASEILRIGFIIFSPVCQDHYQQNSSIGPTVNQQFSNTGLRMAVLHRHLHSRFSGDADAKEVTVLAPSGILHAMHDTVFIRSGIRLRLARTLICPYADLFIYFRPGVPEDELVGNVAADRIAFCIKQGDTD